MLPSSLGCLPPKSGSASTNRWSRTSPPRHAMPQQKANEISKFNVVHAFDAMTALLSSCSRFWKRSFQLMVFMVILLQRTPSLHSGHYGYLPLSLSSAPSPSRSLTMSLLRRRGCFSDKMKSRRRVTLDRVDTHPSGGPKLSLAIMFARKLKFSFRHTVPLNFSAVVFHSPQP